jgi:hypothetical protein
MKKRKTPMTDKLNHPESGYTESLENVDLKEVTLILKDIYTSRDASGIHKPKYFLSNDDIYFVAKQCIEKHGLRNIKLFYEDVKKKGLIGKCTTWSLSAPDIHISQFLGEKNNPAAFGKATNQFEQSNRYMHIIYAPRDISDISDHPPIEAITEMTIIMVKKFGHKAIELLMDYCIATDKIAKKDTWDLPGIEKDILDAIKWKQITSEI